VASLAVAGPVDNNRVVFTNNNWTIDGTAIAREFGIGEVMLMNDFVANGYGLLTLDLSPGSKDVKLLQDAPKVPGAPMACVGAGTGLGEVFLTNPGTDVEGYTAYPTEGGHAEFAPRTPLEFELLAYLMAKFQAKHRVSIERVVSGRGLANVFEFLCQHKDFRDQADKAVVSKFELAGDLQGKVGCGAVLSPLSCGRSCCCRWMFCQFKSCWWARDLKSVSLMLACLLACLLEGGGREQRPGPGLRQGHGGVHRGLR